MSLQPADIAALSRLLDEAEDIPPDERQAWLAALPADQAHLADRLGQMLAERDRSTAGGGPLSTIPELGDTGPTASSGERVGPYRLLHEIGRGGMGSVWLAERADGNFDRQVALKLPRLSWADGLGERMERERRIGALLEHPAIARLYDAGLDTQGRPYIAMEYIEGEPIDTFCRSRRLDVKAVLSLFVQVVRAVAYAHGRLVIHRDLKPANVLVSADGQAHLLDFGIAKLLDAEVNEDSRLTQEQGRLMTLQYAAPEQVAGQAVGVQADVYALGVVLYELLTGVLPQTPRRSTAGAIEDAILDGDAPPASSRVRDKPMQRALRGEIDAILGKAMQRDLVRRYATADAMADDIERHLRGETVSARPDSLLYRTGKTLRRHWVGFGAATAVLVAVLSGSAVAVVQAQRAARSAERERVVKEFVADVFRVNSKVDPKNAALRPTSTQALLEGGAQLIQQRFAGQADLQAELFGVVAEVFSDMGAYRLASDYATRKIEALTLTRAEPKEQSRALLVLAQALVRDQRLSDAEPRARRSLALSAGDPALSLDATLLIAELHLRQGRVDEATAGLKQAESLLHTQGTGPSTAKARVLSLQARDAALRNRLDEALPLFAQAIDTALLAEGPLSMTAINIRLDLSQQLAQTNLEAAQRHFGAASTALRQLGGAHEIRSNFASAALWHVLRVNGGEVTASEAIAELERCRASLATSPLPIPDWWLPQIDFWLGDIQSDIGDIATGLPKLEANEAALRKVYGTAGQKFFLANALGFAYMYAGRHDLADAYLRERQRVRSRAGGAPHPYEAGVYNMIAQNLLMQGRIREAEAVLSQVPHFAPMRGNGLNPDRHNQAVEYMRAKVRLGAGDHGRALALLGASPPLADNSDSDRYEFNELIGEAQCAAGQRTMGLATLKPLAAVAARQGVLPIAPWLARQSAVIGLCALGAGDRKAALSAATQARAAFTAQPDVSPYYIAPLIKLEAALGLKPPRAASHSAEPTTPAPR